MSRYNISSDFDGKTVKSYLSTLGVSRSELIRLKKIENGITVNENHVTVRYILHDGDILDLKRDDLPQDENENIVPNDLGIEIIYEDENIIAVNKPYNMPTHPSHGHFNDSLANGLAFEFDKRGIPFVFRSVNRLDKDTSGVVIVAKNKSAAFEYSNYLQQDKAKKKYTCIVEGIIEDKITIIKNIKRRQESIIERIVCDDGEGQYAATEVVPIKSFNNMTLCDVFPKTGRTHQIRVHLSSIGHPIIGDTLYGHSSDLINRQALHCSQMIIDTKNGIISVTANFSSDIENIIKKYD